MSTYSRDTSYKSPFAHKGDSHTYKSHMVVLLYSLFDRTRCWLLLLYRQLNVEDEDEAGGAAGVDEKDGTADTQGENSGCGGSGGGGGGQRSKKGRPLCAADGCQQQSRTDSKFCCDACGVIHAEAMLSDALRHSLETKIGLERGRRLRETRELKTRKQQVRREA